MPGGALIRMSVEEGKAFLHEGDQALDEADRAASRPPSKRRQRLRSRLVWLASLVAVWILLVYALFPTVFYTSSWVRRTILFEAYRSRSASLDRPELFGLNCTRNFYIDSEPGVRVGAWYTPSAAADPAGLSCDPQQQRPMFAGDDRVVLLLHGITANRGTPHRTHLVRRLAHEVPAHVVTIDYRGFGDSSAETPSLPGETHDALAAFELIRAGGVPSDRIVLWGHSMGTAVAMQVAAELHRRNETPSAMVLEAAFDNVGNVTRHSKISRIWRWMPWFDAVFSHPLMRDPATAADNVLQARLIGPSMPVLMLHAEDDRTTPFEVAGVLQRKIRHDRRNTGRAGPVKSVLFGKEHHLGHNWLANYRGLPDIVRQFFDKHTVGDGRLDQIVL